MDSPLEVSEALVSEFEEYEADVPDGAFNPAWDWPWTHGIPATINNPQLKAIIRVHFALVRALFIVLRSSKPGSRSAATCMDSLCRVIDANDCTRGKPQWKQQHGLG